MLSFKTILGFLFILLIVTITFLAVLSYQKNEDTVTASFWVDHAHQVVEKANEVLSTFQTARLAVNDIIIRRDTSRYPAY
ncbi:MAG TPA: hypothetical protein VFU05_05965, partial [Cyclobacteriaceae bacterium]|nr:hypothetical protein [Cyclobacteriaceae bacterium]